MELEVKKYVIALLNEEEAKMRKTIRYVKNDIKRIQSMKTECNKTSEDKLIEFIKKEPLMYENFIDLQSKIKERSDNEIKELIKTGKLRETFYDKEGRETDEQGNIIKEGTYLSSKQQQYINESRSKLEGGSDSGSSEDNEPVS